MLEQIADTILIGTENFGYGYGPVGNPAIFVFGFPIYLYAIIIVTGMCAAVIVGGFLFKKRGYDPYDICYYALFAITFGVLGARLYVFIFPWDGSLQDWSTFFDFRHGGLGIYGGIILGYLAAFIVAKVRKQDFRIVGDCLMPGLLLAQSIGRWGNFVNQEAFGNLVTDPNLQFFPYATYIDGRGWYQATFFYESMATLIGFIICIVLFTNKKYKLGWTTAFYGIYYGIARLIIEGLRTDSLYLWIGTVQTDIKISQLVSIFAILVGLWTLTKIYRQNIHQLYAKLFKTEYRQLSISRWIVLGLSVLSLSGGVTLFVLGGASNFIAGFCLTVLSIYSLLGVFAINDRMKLYCSRCGTRNEPDGGVISVAESNQISIYVWLALSVLAFVGGIAFIVVGIVTKVANAYVLAVVFMLLCGVAFYRFLGYYKKRDDVEIISAKANQGTSVCQCQNTYVPKLNKFLLYVFPYKVYPNYGVEHLKPFVDQTKKKKQKVEAHTVAEQTVQITQQPTQQLDEQQCTEQLQNNGDKNDKA